MTNANQKETNMLNVQAISNSRREQILTALPWLWLGLSAFWVVVIFATDQVGRPLALWIATTLGPLTILRSRLNAKKTPTE